MKKKNIYIYKTAFLKGKIIVLFWFWKERVFGTFFLPFF